MHDHDPQPWQCDDCGQMNIGPFCECVIDHGEQPNLRPWQCDDCGRVNSPDSPVCRCYFWDDETIREIDNWTERHREPAPDLSQWFTVSIQEGAE